jgi:hypothetical protein
MHPAAVGEGVLLDSEDAGDPLADGEVGVLRGDDPALA